MSDRMLSDEILLGIINSKSGGGGGGGTGNYNDLSNQPQINNNTLVGNKTASDLGLVAAETGKGLSSNNYTDEDKAIVGGVTAALAGKQGSLTAGNNIKLDNDTISVNRWAVPAGKVVYTVITSDENYGQNVHVQRHTTSGGFIDDRVYLVQSWQTKTVDDVISIEDQYAKYKITLLKDSDEQSAGYYYMVNPTTTPTSNSFTFTMPQEENDNDLIIREELDAVSDAVDAIKDGTNIDSFADVESALANKQDKTDNNLETTSKTVVGAVNELKSGLTNLDVALSVSDGSGVNLFIPSNYETFDLTGVGDYRYGHSFNSGEYYVVSNNTLGIYYRIVKEDLSDLGTSVSITSTPQKVTIPSGYIMWVFSNNQATLPNACVSKYSTPYVPYIPSVDARLDAVESGLDDVQSELTNLDDRFVPDNKYDTASINLDTVTSTLFGVYNGTSISGTTPFTLAEGIGHVVMVFAGNYAMITEIVISAYEKKLGFRCKVYSQGAWKWRAWEVMSMVQGS